MKKNLMFIISLVFIGFSSNLFAQQIISMTAESGIIDISKTKYVNNINREYHINIGTQKPIIFSSHITLPPFDIDGDYVEIYAVDANNNRVLRYSFQTSLNTIISKLSTDIPTGKAIVKVFTNSTNSYSYWGDEWPGFVLNYEVENTTILDNLRVLENLEVIGNTTISGNTTINGSNNTFKGVNKFTGSISIGRIENVNKAGIQSYQNLSINENAYGMYSYLKNYSLDPDIYGIYSEVDDRRGRENTPKPAITWAGYFKGGKVEVNSGNLIVTNGKVGIGTTTPYYDLEVNGNIWGKSMDIALNSLMGHDIGTYFNYNNKLMGYHALGWFEDAWMSDGYTFWLSAYAGLKFFTEGKVRMSINKAGNVGIGTTSPGEKLDVIGTIRAHEVKVCLNQGCDFVFEPNYNLMPLNELDNFIKTNKHLPEVSPAAVMESEGINLSEMNALLLQKIEELTLYIIEQDKRIRILENK